MKELRRNMRLIGTLLLCLFIGAGGWFGYTTWTQGARWAMSSSNTRLNRAKNSVVMGTITDRDGYTLAWTDEDGARRYSADFAIRLALSQTVGDTMSMSGTGVQTFFAGTLVGMSGSIIDRTWQWLSGETTRGDDIQLTVDAKLCGVIARNFPSGYNGAVVVINYRTGEILAMVSMPEYDPGDMSTNVPDTAYFNRCLQGQYTPGSTFKIVTLASALENLPGALSHAFTCTGFQAFGNGVVTCLSGTRAHGQMDLRSAFVESCNVSFATLSYELGQGALLRTAETFGFNDDFTFSDVMLYASAFPRDIGSVSELAWSGVGQGRVLVTPLHMAMIAGAIANGGTMMKPWLIEKITNSLGAATAAATPTAYRRVLSESVAGKIAEYMYETVQSGTATRAAIKGYAVGGKTGSAEVSDDKTVETNAWFTGFIYDDAHPYAISVVIEGGGAGARMPSELAAKALKKAIEYVG